MEIEIERPRGDQTGGGRANFEWHCPVCKEQELSWIFPLLWQRVGYELRCSNCGATFRITDVKFAPVKKIFDTDNKCVLEVKPHPENGCRAIDEWKKCVSVNGREMTVVFTLYADYNHKNKEARYPPKYLEMDYPSTGECHRVQVPSDCRYACKALEWLNWGVGPQKIVEET